MSKRLRPLWGKQPPELPPPPDAENTSGMGKGMIALAIIVFLLMLTFFFQSALEKQYNPNQKVQSQKTADGRVAVVLRRNRSGHYVSSGSINGRKVVFLLDTGATQVAIPQSLSQYLGLRPGRAISLSTANGKSIGQRTIIDELRIGDIVLYQVPAVITPNLDDILLGMSALKELEFTQKGNTLTLKQ